VERSIFVMSNFTAGMGVKMKKKFPRSLNT
jgi:hypothetical protein